LHQVATSSLLIYMMHGHTYITFMYVCIQDFDSFGLRYFIWKIFTDVWRSAASNHTVCCSRILLANAGLFIRLYTSIWCYIPEDRIL